MAKARAGSASGTADYPLGYWVSFGIEPTRNNSAHLMLSWHHDSDGEFSEYDYEHPAEVLFVTEKSLNNTALASYTWYELFGVEPDTETMLYQGWLSKSVCEEFGDCYVMVVVHTNGTTAWGFSNDTLSHYTGKSWATTPTVSYDTSSNEILVGPTNLRGAKLLEFRDIDAYNSMSEQDIEARANFMLSSMINLEGYGDYRAFYENCNAVLHRWPKNRTYTVGFVSLGGTCEGIDYEIMVKSTMKNVISEINSYMQEFGIRFSWQPGSGADADVVVRYGTMGNLWPDLYPSGYTGARVQGGRWYTWWDDDGEIYQARVDIAAEAHYYTTFTRICLEEFYQALGCGYDQWEYPENTTTVEMGGMHQPEYITEKDAEMLRLTYSDMISAGEAIESVSVSLDLPYGVKCVRKDGPSNSTDRVSVGFLKPGHRYQVRAWVVGEGGDMSVLEGVEWLTIEIDNTPQKWSWTSIGPSGAVYRASAREWNEDFFTRINEIRRCNRWNNVLSEYTAFLENPAVKGENMSVRTFNHAAWAIAAMYPEEQRASIVQELEIYPGDTITVTQFNKLMDRLNDCI